MGHGGLGILIIVMTALPAIATMEVTPGPYQVLTWGVGLGIGLPFLAFALWFPTMRYELDDQTLSLHYGPGGEALPHPSG